MNALEQRGEAQTSSNKTILGKPSQSSTDQPLPLENLHSPHATSPLPIWEGRGDRSLNTPNNHHNRGKVSPSLPSPVWIGLDENIVSLRPLYFIFVNLYNPLTAIQNIFIRIL